MVELVVLFDSAFEDVATLQLVYTADFNVDLTLSSHYVAFIMSCLKYIMLKRMLHGLLWDRGCR